MSNKESSEAFEAALDYIKGLDSKLTELHLEDENFTRIDKLRLSELEVILSFMEELMVAQSTRQKFNFQLELDDARADVVVLLGILPLVDYFAAKSGSSIVLLSTYTAYWMDAIHRLRVFAGRNSASPFFQPAEWSSLSAGEPKSGWILGDMDWHPSREREVKQAAGVDIVLGCSSVEKLLFHRRGWQLIKS